METAVYSSLRQKKSMQKEKINHIAIIMDGNGRWAKQRGLERVFGHKEGANAVRRVVEEAGKLQIPYLTLYTFSTENWNRPEAEVKALMSLLVNAIRKETENLIQNNVRLNAIGNLDDLPESCRKELLDAIEQTSHCTGLTLTLALSYSGRSELTRAARHIAQQVADGCLTPDTITDETIGNNLYTNNIPDPDILIRTGGEQRISNFLLWQLAYTELFFLPVMWPDFTGDHLREVIDHFLSRERRFGKTSEQVQK